MSWYVQNAEEVTASGRPRERPRQYKGRPGPGKYGREAFEYWSALLSRKGESLQKALKHKVGRILGCGKYGCVVDAGVKKVIKLSPLPEWNWEQDEELRFWTKMKAEQERPDSPASAGVVRIDKVWVATDADTDAKYMVVLRNDVQPFTKRVPYEDDPGFDVLAASDATAERGITLPLGVLRPEDLGYHPETSTARVERATEGLLTAIREYRLGDVHLENVGWQGDVLVVSDADYAGVAPEPDEQLRVNRERQHANSHYERARQEFYKMTEQLPGGLASGMQPEDFDAEELERGIATEMEHTDDRALAAEIAMDHLVEDPLYYERLREMKRGARRPRRRIQPWHRANSDTWNQDDADSLEPNARCNCENSACPHQPAACPNEATGEYKVMYLGTVCASCYARMPKQYRLNDGTFYVFEMRSGKPYRQVNVKPLTLDKAKQLARIGAQQGKHDRVVTTDPRKDDFRVVGEYEAGLTENRRCPVGTEVQTLIFDSELFTASTAKSWAKQHGFKYGKVDSKEETHRLRQAEPGEFRAGSFRTISFAEGVQAVIGCPR